MYFVRHLDLMKLGCSGEFSNYFMHKMNESEPVNPAWHGAQKPVKNWKQTVSFLEVPLDRFDEF